LLYEILASSGPCVVKNVKPIPHCDHAFFLQVCVPGACGVANTMCFVALQKAIHSLLLGTTADQALSLVKGTLAA
jgi:hypothetical protein